MIISEDDIPTFSRLPQSLTPPTHSHPTPPPSHSISTYLQTWTRFYSHLPKQIGAERGGLPQSERSVSQTVVHNGDKTVGGKQPRERGKKLSFPEHNPTKYVLVTGRRGRGKTGSAVSCLEKKRTFSEAERVGSPSSLGPRDPTSTSSLAERNMQTHFIDFWGFAEKPNWSFRTGRGERATGARGERERDGERERR